MLFFGHNNLFDLFCPKYVLFFGHFNVYKYSKAVVPIYDIETTIWFMLVD